MNIFDKWNQSADLAGLQKDIDNSAVGSTEYREVPVGNYEIKVEKMELKESSTHKPMFSAQFRIIEGEFKKSCLFMNQVITEGFQIHIVNEFLRSLGSKYDVEFKDYAQYNGLIMDIMENIDGSLEYLVEYKLKKEFPVYTIKEVYELD